MFSLIVRAGLLLLAAFVLYLASYSLFLKLAKDSQSPYYRSPILYRPVEWVIVHTPLQATMLQWSGILGVRPQTEVQIWFFAQGISDPSSQIHFNFQ